MCHGDLRNKFREYHEYDYGWPEILASVIGIGLAFVLLLLFNPLVWIAVILWRKLG